MSHVSAYATVIKIEGDFWNKTQTVYLFIQIYFVSFKVFPSLPWYSIFGIAFKAASEFEIRILNKYEFLYSFYGLKTISTKW